MPFPLRTPRVNNNDDFVRLTHLFVEPGAEVRTGDPLAEVETDKASFSVEAERDGYILSVEQKLREMVAVGSVLFWMGETADEKAPAREEAKSAAADGAAPTLKARLLLAQYGLRAEEVPAAGTRLSAEDVENYARSRGLALAAANHRTDTTVAAPGTPGVLRELNPAERGMLRTVTWHRDEAVPGYVETGYDPQPWMEFAEAYQKKHRLLLSPLLGLLAWRLADVARRNPKLNSTIHAGARHEYSGVNLGFTVQSGEVLYLVVVESAGTMKPKQFLDRLTALQRQAMANRLEAGAAATVSFTSMARWAVTRHLPILPPQTSLIAAHSSPLDGKAILGATYDHRVLSGYDAIRALIELGRPPAPDEFTDE